MVLCLKTWESRSLPGLQKIASYDRQIAPHIAAVIPHEFQTTQTHILRHLIVMARGGAAQSLVFARGVPKREIKLPATSDKVYRGVEQPGSSSGS